jgi:hypothetical protein
MYTYPKNTSAAIKKKFLARDATSFHPTNIYYYANINLYDRIIIKYNLIHNILVNDFSVL